jgi:PAS domain S-box-containing protein
MATMASVLVVGSDPERREHVAMSLEGLHLDVRVVELELLHEHRRQVESAVVVLDVERAGLAEWRSSFEQLKDHAGTSIVIVIDAVDTDILELQLQAPSVFLVLRDTLETHLEVAVRVAVERSDRERAAAHRESWYATTLRSIADAVITADHGPLITYMNTAAENLTGWTAGEGVGRALEDVFAVDQTRGGADVVLRRMDGSTIEIEHNAAPLFDENGELQGVVVVFHDITEKRRVQQQLAQSDRLASIGTLAAGIAHELNNPLAFVTSNIDYSINELELMRKRLPEGSLDADARDSVASTIDALRDAIDGAQRAASIVRDMKTFARHDSPFATSRLDINTPLATALRLTMNEMRHRAEIITALAKVPPVNAEDGRLVQVFVNILTNAIQALDDKPNHKIEVTTQVDGGNVVVRVKDSGRGIPREQLGRVFEPFFTTKGVGQGLGLGLSISHALITAFGGVISIESTVGVGTSVSVALPIAEGSVEMEKAVERGGLVGQSRVLVIDDEELIGTAIRRILTREGAEVVVESSGVSAVARLAAGESFDAILCDLMMPEFSGVEVYEQIEQKRPELKTRVIFMTGNAFTQRASTLFDVTTNVRLNKPFVPADLTRAVAEVLRRHGQAEPI